MFSVTYDTIDRIVRYRIEGFWTVETAQSFCSELSTEVRRRAVAGRKPRVLADASKFAVQSAPVAELIQVAMLSEIFPVIDRLALIVATTLNKLQVERAGGVPTMQVFLNEGKALAWLREGDR